MRYRAPIIAAVVSLVLVLAFFFFLWKPKNEELEEVRAETAQLETQRGQLTNELRRLEEIQEREVDFRAALAKLEEYIPNGPAQAAIIRQLQLTADAAGVTISNVTFSEPEAVEEAPPTGEDGMVLATVNVTMVAEGGYFQVADFFRRIEVDVPRAVLVQSIALTEGEEGFPVLANTWTGQLFTVIPDPAPAPEETAEPEAEAEGEADAETDADAEEGDGEEIQASAEGEDL
jgi:Tfp pilus assembly protein PilO